MQPLPGPELVRAIVGDRSDTSTLADLLGHAAQAARTLTLGAGFSAAGTMVEPDIAEILVRSVARSLLNPELPLSCAAPPFTGRPGTFPDWTDADVAVLDGYRALRG